LGLAVTGKPFSEKRERSQGLWIAFFGPDGVGKSAVIGRLESQLAASFDECIFFHFRPTFRGDGSGDTVVSLPHAKPPRGLLVSWMKLLYWLADCWYGYLLVIRPGKRKHRLILFDRYFPDLLVDPVRYRIPKSAIPFAELLTDFLPRPDLYVLLDAPAEVSWARKRELSLPESRRQRNAYLRLFAGFPCRLLVNADCELAEVARNVAIAVHNLTADSLRQEPELPSCPALS
jgi:thymidylate kinase